MHHVPARLDAVLEPTKQAVLDTDRGATLDTLDARDYRVSFAKVRSVLGFTPQASVEGAAGTIYGRLEDGTIKNPAQRIYYNHYFDSTEE